MPVGGLTLAYDRPRVLAVDLSAGPLALGQVAGRTERRPRSRSRVGLAALGCIDFCTARRVQQSVREGDTGEELRGAGDCLEAMARIGRQNNVLTGAEVTAKRE